jgi:hypothetical protein
MNLSNRIIKYEENMYRVYDYTSNEDLQLGNSYIFGGKTHRFTIQYVYVLPFKGQYDKTLTSPGIYLKDGQLRLIHPRTDKEKQIYNISRVFTITPKTINSDLAQYLNEIDLTELKYTGNVFEPKIKDTDDVGIKAMRLAIWKKQIDFNSYANRFERPWDRANMKKSLMQDSTLTFSKLKTYADVFDLEYGIIIFDKPGAKDPLSKEGHAMIVFNDMAYDIDDENVDVIWGIDDIMDKKGE